MPWLMASMVAAPMTPLIPGAGPPPTRIAILPIRVPPPLIAFVLLRCHQVAGVVPGPAAVGLPPATAALWAASRHPQAYRPRLGQGTAVTTAAPPAAGRARVARRGGARFPARRNRGLTPPVRRPAWCAARTAPGN